MIIARIHHVQITIPRGSEDAARAFYCDVMRLKELEKPTSLAGRGGFWLQVGDQEVHVGTDDSDRSKTKAHIAYEVDDIPAWRARIEAAGCKAEDSVPIEGYERFEFRDPFGNRAELIAIRARNA
ncbi:VOC family protein [soil metagenome]